MSNTTYIEVADGLGARLCRDAIWSGGRCNWLGDSMEFIESSWQIAHRAYGPELYAGTSGIALFLACLFSHTQEKIFKKTAEGALNCAVSQLARLDPMTGFGFYSGLTGIAYVLTEAGGLLGEDAFVQRGLKLLEEICSSEPVATQSWDIVSGSAGVVPVLLKLHVRYGLSFLFDAAVRHGDHVLQAANHSEKGWSWKTLPDPGIRNLTGFSHGTAGIAWALLELYHKTGETRFLKAEQEALRYERGWFDAEQENWPDFRSSTETAVPVCAMAWCHGAPGIGLARVRIYELLRENECLAEAQAAIRTTTRMLSETVLNNQANYSLCHGNFGNAELLISASDVLADTDSMKTIHRLAEHAIEKYHLGRNLWPCGVLNGGESPNLMLGLAGIGYFYLRLHDTKKIPSVLRIGPN
jgi:lantibiotic biosynthesis protein